MKKIKSIIVIICFFLTFMMMPNASSNEDYTEIEIIPNQYDGFFHVGLNINLSIFVTPQDGKNIDTVATDLITFSPDILQCTSIAWGNLFLDKTVTILGNINNSLGTIRNMLWGSYTSTTVPGCFVNISFDVISQGVGFVNINQSNTGVAYNGSALDFIITHNFTIHVREGQRPYPPYNPTPANNTAYKNVYNIWLNCTVSDPDGDSMNVSFYWGNNTLIGTIHGVANGTIASLFLPSYWHRVILGYNCTWVTHDTTHYWYAIADDGMNTTQSSTWNFHTSKAWDLNADRRMNAGDVSILVSHYALRVIPPGASSWDINEDTFTNSGDISLLVSHYGQIY